MKRLLLALILIITVLAFAGCTSSNGNPGEAKNTAAAASQNQDGSKTSQNSGAPGNMEPVKPGTVPQLSSNQKDEVDSRIRSVLNSMDKALNSLQDPQDIDIDSVN
jgi:hypothetical protein